MTGPAADPFQGWVEALAARYLATLTFQEVRRALQALSSLYVERRGRLASGAPLDGAGKRAAFALFYGPMHYLMTRKIAEALQAADPPPSRIVDLGCGSGAAGAAWALEGGGHPRVLGIDRSGWAVDEARRTLRALALRGETVRADLGRAALPGRGAGIVAAYTLNELEAPLRERLLDKMIGAARRGARVLVIEPISRKAAPWWERWAGAFAAAGGRDDEWRFHVPLPDILERLDRAAGLDHEALTARSLWLTVSRAHGRFARR